AADRRSGVGRVREPRERDRARHGVARAVARRRRATARRPDVGRGAPPARGPRDPKRRFARGAAGEGGGRMADARRLIALLALALGGAAHAAGSCEESRGQTGLALTATPEGQLSVTVVDPDSAAAA